MLLTEVYKGNDKKNIANLWALGDTLSACPVEITLFPPPREQRGDLKSPKE